MNATQWETLTDFTKWLGREGKSKTFEQLVCGSIARRELLQFLCKFMEKRMSRVIKKLAERSIIFQDGFYVLQLSMDI